MGALLKNKPAMLPEMAPGVTLFALMLITTAYVNLYMPLFFLFRFQFDQTFEPIIGNRDDDDLRQTAPGSFPPEFYLNLLKDPAVKAKIGATSTYGECPDAPFELFSKTGDVLMHSATWAGHTECII